jgi:hypothetical protein
MEVNNQLKPNQTTTFDELCAGLSPDGKYSHLQVFLYRIGSTHKIGQEYLYVSRSAFGKVKLNDINYKDNLVQLELQNSKTGASEQFSLDVNNTEFKFLLVSWSDIITLVMKDDLVKTDEGDLLEFEY